MPKKIENKNPSKRQKAAFKAGMKRKAKLVSKDNKDIRIVGSNEAMFHSRIGELIASKHGPKAQKNYHAAVVTNLNADWNPFDIFSNNVNLSDIYSGRHC